MSVDIRPMPTWARGKRYRVSAPPVFQGEPAREDLELALALFEELDPESQAWYGGQAFVDRLNARLNNYPNP